MDITKLFDTQDNIAELDNSRLEAMIDAALACPQLKKPANQNRDWLRPAMAVAAALVLVMTVSLSMGLPGQSVSNHEAGDAYDEISDLVIYETLKDLS